MPSKKSLTSRLEAGSGAMARIWSRLTLRSLMLSLLVGAVSGLGALAFFVCLEWGRWLLLGWLAGAPSPAPPGEHLVHLAVTTPYRPWLLCLLPALGGLVSVIIVRLFAPETGGDGMDAMINAFHNKRGFIRGRVPFVKSVSSIITLASGGSAGREGPIAQIGAGFGSWLARSLGLSTQEQRIYLLAGCAAGLGSIFRAPLGAAITSVEVPYSEDFESEAVIPCVIASVIAYTIFTGIMGFNPMFDTPRYVFRDPRELLVYGLLGLVCVPMGRFYVRLFHGTSRYFENAKFSPYLRPVLGGLGVGVMALALPQVLGGGYGYLQLAIDGRLAISIMILAAVAKIVATSLTIGSGGSGGVFGPTLVIGGMLGGAVGFGGQELLPHIVTQPGAYVLVGMAAFFAGVAKAPLGALIMVTEMTGSYGLLPPLMLVSVIAILFNGGPSIYISQVLNKFHSPAHGHELIVDVLSDLSVEQALRPGQEVTTLRPRMRFFELRRLIARTRQTLFPVVDESGKHVGNLSLRDVREVMFEDSLGDLVVVGELAGPPVSLTLDQDLNRALRTFLECGYGQVPVVRQQEGRDVVLGLLRHEDVIAAYHAKVSQRGEEAA